MYFSTSCLFLLLLLFLFILQPKNVRSEVSPLDAGMSLVVSNCGVPKLSSEDWRKVLNSSLILAANNPPGAPLLVNDIMNQFCNHCKFMC